VSGLLRPRVALVLGGGGARGLAHIGVLEVLEREGLAVDLVVGTSAGALVGALYCAYGNTGDVKTRIARFAASPQFQGDTFADLVTMSPPPGADQGFVQTLRRFYKLGLFFATTLFQKSFIDGAQFERDIAAVVPDVLMEALPRRLAIVATDLREGREVVLSRGSLRTAVMASSAIAGFFPPVETDGVELVDGGFVNLVPVEVALRLGADVVIAVDVSSPVADSKEFSRRGGAISLRASAIQAETSRRFQVRHADVLVRPSVSEFHWAAFAEYETIIPRGREAAEGALPEIRRVLRHARWRKPFWNLFGHRRFISFEEETS